jgi:hypothetical protein
MYTWKTIPSSDYSIRTFKAYKNWTFESGSDVLLMIAEDTLIYNESNTIQLTSDFEYNKHSLYGQISASFYSLTDTQIAEGKRRLGTKAKIFSIPNEFIGDGIKTNSLSIIDGVSSVSYVDNASGSLMSGSTVVGDVFYNNGIIVYTDDATINNVFTGDWDINFKSTQTITEHEIFISVEKNEFNISKNPSALRTENQRWYTLPESDILEEQRVLVDAGIQYIRKRTELVNGDIIDFRYGSKVSTGISGGFEHYDISSSVDLTGSFLTPFVTTIGLYDDTNTLMAVAKLPRPIKIEPIMPINFIVRFDV